MTTRGDAIAAQRARWREAGLYRPELLTEAMDVAAVRHADDRSVFLSAAGEQTLSLAEITAGAYDVAHALRGRGVGPGDVVAVQLPDGVECVVAYRAALALGATLVPIPAIYGEKELRFILADSGARCLVTADRWRSIDYTTALPRLVAEKGVEFIIVVGADVPQGCISWCDLTEERATRTGGPPPLIGVTPQSDAAIIYTSGSTSDPKGVRHSHETLLFELGQGNPAWRLDGARWFSVLPFAHMAGFLAICRELLFGGEMVCVDRWDAAQALDLIRRHRLTSGTLPPFHLGTLLEAASAAGVMTLVMTDCLVGSTAVQAALIETADKVGCWSYRCYGSSEHPTISTAQKGDSLATRAGTDGAILPEVVVRIVDDDDTDLPPGSEGDILSSGPDLFLGYTDPAATAEAFTPDGFYRTGDIGVVNDGRLTITGRRKDLIIRGGENLSPKEIEDVLGTHPLVLEVAVVGAPDANYGERPWAFVITRDGSDLTLPAIQEHFRTTGIARQKTPEGVTVVAGFPRTAAGKIRKNELRRSLRGNSAPIPTAATGDADRSVAEPRQTSTACST